MLEYRVREGVLIKNMIVFEMELLWLVNNLFEHDLNYLVDVLCKYLLVVVMD